MKIEDIKVGETYQLDFAGKLSAQKTEVKAVSCNSGEFVTKYRGTLMRDHQNKNVVILLSPTRHNPPAVRFHFESDPSTCYCAIFPQFFKPLSISNSVSACQCNLWLTGCNCGIFKAEQAKS